MNCLTLCKCNYIYFIVPTPGPHIRSIQAFRLLEKTLEVIQMERASYQILFLNYLATRHLIPETLLASWYLCSHMLNGLATTGATLPHSNQMAYFLDAANVNLNLNLVRLQSCRNQVSIFSARSGAKALLLSVFLKLLMLTLFYCLWI